MKIIITHSLSKDLKKLGLSEQIIIKHFEKTYLGSEKCPLIAHHNEMKIYKSYLTKLDRMISLVTVGTLIVPIFVAAKSHPIASNITKDSIQKHIYHRIASQEEQIKNNLFTSYAL